MVVDDVYIGQEKDIMESVTNPNSTNKNFIRIQNFTIGVMDKQVGILENFRIDAVVGLAYKGLIYQKPEYLKNPHQMTPIFDAIIKQKVLHNNVVTYNYVFHDEEKLGFKS